MLAQPLGFDFEILGCRGQQCLPVLLPHERAPRIGKQHAQHRLHPPVGGHVAQEGVEEDDPGDPLGMLSGEPGSDGGGESGSA